jgi:RNA polymerase sigma-70 factor (ECF subfamily)
MKPSGIPAQQGWRLLSGEGELIRRAQAGDVEAFCALARAHERRIYSLALHYCRHQQDAEDLSQEVWLKAFAALKNFRYESTFYTWLRTITIHCFLNHQRPRTIEEFGRKANIRLVSIDAVSRADLRSCTSNQENALNNNLLVDKVMEALSELPAQQRLIFLLKHCEGMTYAEIAGALGTSTGTVKKSLFRAVEKLREHFDVSAEPYDYIACAAAEY